MTNQNIVARLRNYDQCNDSDIDEAADMLEFMFSLMQMNSAKMDGQHRWRFSLGWPMAHANGPTPEDAIRAAMRAVKEATK